MAVTARGAPQTDTDECAAGGAPINDIFQVRLDKQEADFACAIERGA
ncbi:hypothetical protein J6500_06995 [Bradyrhizobium sp. WSM 1704]|nr:hypothetical protein [Bradyrhizobium semiaridum]MCA6121651.1 hypothetical protein [Bradyrhizobium semiaridum]